MLEVRRFPANRPPVVLGLSVFWVGRKYDGGAARAPDGCPPTGATPSYG